MTRGPSTTRKARHLVSPSARLLRLLSTVDTTLPPKRNGKCYQDCSQQNHAQSHPPRVTPDTAPIRRPGYEQHGDRNSVRNSQGQGSFVHENKRQSDREGAQEN